MNYTLMERSKEKEKKTRTQQRPVLEFLFGESLLAFFGDVRCVYANLRFISRTEYVVYSRLYFDFLFLPLVQQQQRRPQTNMEPTFVYKV